MTAQLFAQSYDAGMSGDGSGYQWIVDDKSVSQDAYRVRTIIILIWIIDYFLIYLFLFLFFKIDGELSLSALNGWRTGVGFVPSR